MFEGFSLSDFEAYLPEKWGSNMFTLPRRKVKDKLDLVGRRLAEDLEALELPLVKHLSDDHPSLWNKKRVDTQWLFFSRDEAAQKKLSEIIDTERTLAATLADPTPLYRHVFIGVSINQDGLEMGIRLHYDAWVDRKNLQALLANEEGTARFETLRKGLSPDWRIGLVGSEMMSPGDLNLDQMESVLAEFEAGKGWIFAGLRLPGEKVAELGSDVMPLIVESFKKLEPVYRFVAWSPENDAVSMDSLVAVHQQELRASQAERDKERSEREARRSEEEKERARLREEVEDRIHKEQEWRERERAFRRSLAQKKSEEEERASRHAEVAKNAAAVVQVPIPESDAASEPAPEKKAEPVESERRPAPERKSSPRPDRRPDQRPRSRGTHQERPKPRISDPKPKGPGRSEPIVSNVSDERKADIHVGDGVIVKKGFLTGKFGIVHAIEEEDLKVAFGALTSRVPRADVEGRGPAPGQERGGQGRKTGRK